MWYICGRCLDVSKNTDCSSDSIIEYMKEMYNSETGCIDDGNYRFHIGSQVSARLSMREREAFPIAVVSSPVVEDFEIRLEHYRHDEGEVDPFGDAYKQCGTYYIMSPYTLSDIIRIANVLCMQIDGNIVDKCCFGVGTGIYSLIGDNESIACMGEHGFHNVPVKYSDKCDDNRITLYIPKNLSEPKLKDIPDNNPIQPNHYTRLNPQPKNVIRDWGLNFNLGSAVKYISRAGHKDDIIQDLKKAQEFIQFEIDYLERK